MVSFVPKTIYSWSDFVETADEHRSGRWIYRGQRCHNWSLMSNFERALGGWEVDILNGATIEWEMIRDFRRRYIGDHSIIDKDTLHCLALMQHHGAPTRLMDWTYSPYIAVRFAIEHGARKGSVWCVNCEWCEAAAKKIVGSDMIQARNEGRDESSFKQMYMPDSVPQKFVFTENPIHLNPRLTIQQGVFLCPGDIQAPFGDNLEAMDGCQEDRHILKLNLDFSIENVRDFASRLTRMNVDSSALFPGLDGFARSLEERIPLYSNTAKNRI
jgi:FRG domain